MGDKQISEAGQSLILVAFAFVGLVAFVGLAVDVGFLYARSSQLAAAVDAAALAAVTELNGGEIEDADTKAAQFLNTNGMPLSVTQSLESQESNSIIGTQEYTLTATWPVELYFLKVIGFNSVTLTRSATAGYFPLADIYASRRVETGALSTSNQSVFGPQICTSYGDPFSPLNSTFRPPGTPSGPFTYNYRILIPADYSHDVVRVELFDPDSINQSDNTHDIAHTDVWIAEGNPPLTTNVQCTGGSANQINACLLSTGESTLVPPYDLDQINLWWFVRIDETRGAGTPPGNGTCSNPPGGVYNAGYNTATRYDLYYYRQNPDGTIVRVELASYTGQTGDGARDTGDHLTDLRWVSPGGQAIYDQPAAVPTDCGSPNGGDWSASCPGGSPAGPGSGFEISIGNDLVDILTDAATGARYIYLDVTALSGSAENGFEVWAGPPDYVDTISSDVNSRNVQVINDPTSHYSDGATVYGIGNLPMNSNYSQAVDIPLIYVGPELAGQNVFVSLFDSDSGATPPIVFYFDSLAFDSSGSPPGNNDSTDWSAAFAVSGQPDADGTAYGVRCNPGSCNNQWVTPSYVIQVPTMTEDCDFENPDPQICTPFYGGRLMARYQGGGQDTYGWQITVTGLPYLIR